MGRTFSEDDFADAPADIPAVGSPMSPAPKPSDNDSGLDFLLKAAGIDPMQVLRQGTERMAQMAAAPAQLAADPIALRDAMQRSAKENPVTTRVGLQAGLGQAGELLGGPIGGGLGTAAGELGAQALLGEDIDLKKVGTAGAMGAAIPAAVRGGKALLASKAATKAASQGMRVLGGIGEDVGEQAWKDSGILWRAESLKEAGNMMDDAAKGMGIKTGNDGIEAAFGVRHFSDGLALKADRMVRKLKADEALTPQIAFSARQAMTNALKGGAKNSPKSAMNKRSLIEAVGIVDDYLSSVPGGDAMKGALKGYRESIVKSAFNTLFSQNANKSANALRGTLAAGGAYHQYKQGDPAEALLIAAAFSPLGLGAALRAKSLAGAVASPALRAGVAKKMSEEPK